MTSAVKHRAVVSFWLALYQPLLNLPASSNDILCPFVHSAWADDLILDKEYMRQDWLETSIGVNVVAIGLVAIVFSLVLFTAQDTWILLTGKLVVLTGLRGIWYLLCAGTAALFSAITVFIWRPGFPRIVIGLFSISMASHVVEQFVTLPTQRLKLVAFCRIVVALSLILQFLRYRLTTTTANFRKVG